MSEDGKQKDLGRKQKGLTQIRIRLLLAVLLGLVVLLTASFLFEWRAHGDVHAEAFGSLLSFFAAITTAIVTLFYVHFTRQSLAAAEAAIEMQREQWQMRMTVKPRFWIVKPAHDPTTKVRDRSVTFRKDMASRYRKESSQASFYYDAMNWPLCAVDVWNDGERSMRISSYRLWVRGEESLFIARPIVGLVVPPNELRSFAITEEMIALAFHGTTFMERYERSPREITVVGLRLLYSDWQGDDHPSHDEYYRMTASEEKREVTLEKFAELESDGDGRIASSVDTPAD